MGLKVVGFGPYSAGKSFFGLSMAELGPVGLIDSEDRMEWYTIPLAAPHATEPFPFDNPRQIRSTLPSLGAARHTVYLVQTKEVGVTGRAVEAFCRDPRIVGTVIDSGSVLWDLLQDTRDESDPKMAMLSWTPVKRTNRRLMYAAMSGGKHLFITAHLQEKFTKVGKELVVSGVRPWLEKKTPHWVDLVLEFGFPDNAPHPALRVDAEKVGAQGGLRKGALLGDFTKGEPAETFARLLRRLAYVAPAPPAGPDIAEIEYRNQSTVDAIGGAPPVPGVDEDRR